MTLCNTAIEGIISFGALSNNYLVWSNIPEKNYTEVDSSFVVDSNLYVGGRIFCNGFEMTALENYVIHDMTVYGTMTLCNAYLEGVLAFGATDNSYTVWSNIPDKGYSEFDNSVVIDSNLYVAGRIFCNGFGMTALESYVLNDAIITGTMTLCNTAIEGVISFGATCNHYKVWSNIPEKNYVETDSSFVVDSNLYVGGRIFCNGFEMTALENYVIHDMTVYGTMTLCNAYLEGVLAFGATDNSYTVWSNIPDKGYSEFDNSVVIDSNLYVAGRIFCNGFGMTALESYIINDAIITGTMTLCNTAIQGIVSFGATCNQYTVWSNISENNYVETDSSLVVDSNLYVGGRIFCNGFSMTALESYTLHDAIITGTMTLCNTAIQGIVSFGATCNQYTVWSNIPENNYVETDSSLVIDSNLYVGGRIFCNGFSMTSLESYVLNDAIITGTMTLCNTDLQGIITFGSSNHYTVWNNVNEPNYTQTESSLVIDSNLYVGGRIFCNGFEMSAINLFNGTYQTLDINSNINIHNTLNFTNNTSNTSNNSIWNVNLNNSNLVFTSQNNTQVIFTDNFTSSVLNFTGSHTCKPDKLLKDSKKKKDLIGKIVISTGKYDNDILIDDAVPIIKLATRNNDPRCFGVISKFEENNTERSYHIGNLKFKKNKNKSDIKVVVNGAGEGGIWVTNINGNIKNGDFITSSDIPGYGMCQIDDINKNYTVAKATCTCYFNLDSKKYKCEEFNFKGKTYKRAFIGCIYKF